jgi:hypothetical protein
LTTYERVLTDSINGAIFLSPSIELQPNLCFWKGQLVANEGKRHGTGWKVKPFVDVGEEDGQEDGEDAGDEGERVFDKGVYHDWSMDVKVWRISKRER